MCVRVTDVPSLLTKYMWMSVDDVDVDAVADDADARG